MQYSTVTHTLPLMVKNWYLSFSSVVQQPLCCGNHCAHRQHSVGLVYTDEHWHAMPAGKLLLEKYFEPLLA